MLIHYLFYIIHKTQEPLHNPPHILKQRLKDNKLNSLYFARECIRIFFLGHYLFLQAHSFLRALLSKNCSHLQVEQIKIKVCQQISVRFLAPNRSYCLFSSKFSISLIKLYYIEKQIIFFFPFCSSLEEDANFFCFVVAGIDWNRTVIYASFQWSTRARCDIIFQLKRKKVSSKSRPMIRNTRSQL